MDGYTSCSFIDMHLYYMVLCSVVWRMERICKREAGIKQTVSQGISPRAIINHDLFATERRESGGAIALPCTIPDKQDGWATNSILYVVCLPTHHQVLARGQANVKFASHYHIRQHVHVFLAWVMILMHAASGWGQPVEI